MDAYAISAVVSVVLMALVLTLSYRLGKAEGKTSILEMVVRENRNMALYGTPEPIKARVEDQDHTDPEIRAQKTISDLSVTALAQHIMDEGGVSFADAYAEAEEMLGQFDPTSQDAPDRVQQSKVVW